MNHRINSITRKKGTGTNPKENPDPERLARTDKETFILKPRQCFRCLTIFTPADEEQTHCPDCIDRSPKEDRLAECKKKNCKEIALTTNKSGMCKAHYEEKKTESREWYGIISQSQLDREKRQKRESYEMEKCRTYQTRQLHHHQRK